MDTEIMAKVDALSEAYAATTVDKPGIKNQEDHEAFYKERERLFAFLDESGAEIVASKDDVACVNGF